MRNFMRGLDEGGEIGDYVVWSCTMNHCFAIMSNIARSSIMLLDVAGPVAAHRWRAVCYPIK